MHWRVLPSPWTMPMPNFAERAEEGHLLGGDLAGAEERDRVRAVLRLDGLEAVGPTSQRRRPSRPASRRGVAQQRRRRAIGGTSGGERLPAFRAGHAEVDRDNRSSA